MLAFKESPQIIVSSGALGLTAAFGIATEACESQNPLHWSMIQKSGYRFSLGQTQSVCPEIMLKQKYRAV
jgi:hypothetical protein